MSAEIEQSLLVRLEHANSWLKFAEAKNGVLVTLCGGLVTVLDKYDWINSAATWPRFFFWLGVGLVLLASILSLLSFLPEYERNLFEKPFGPTVPRARDNLFFYGDIANYTDQEYREAVLRSYSKDDGSSAASNKQIKDLCHQLVQNSRIAVRKYRLFNIGVHGLLAGFICIVGALTYAA